MSAATHNETDDKKNKSGDGGFIAGVLAGSGVFICVCQQPNKNEKEKNAVRSRTNQTSIPLSQVVQIGAVKHV